MVAGFADWNMPAQHDILTGDGDGLIAGLPYTQPNAIGRSEHREWADQQRANACLIASAPDLLDVLKEARDWLDDLDVEDAEAQDIIDSSVILFKQAIAKAGGAA